MCLVNFLRMTIISHFKHLHAVNIAPLGRLLLILAMSLYIFSGSVESSYAQPLSRLSSSLTESAGVMVFSLESEGGSLLTEQVKVERDLPNRLKMTIEGVDCPRAWQTDWKAKGLKRALLYPSKKVRGRCFLKVKMKRKINNKQLNAVRIQGEDQQVVVKFSWKPERLGEDVSLLELNDSQEESDQSTIIAKEVAKSVAATPNTADTPNTAATPNTVDTPNTADTPGFKVDMIEEPVEGSEPLTEVAVGQFPKMDVERDRLGIQERPHSVIETVVIGQVEKARAFSPAPVIFSNAISIMSDERTSGEELFLERASLLLGELLDREALSRGGSIWLMDKNLRAQTQLLNTNQKQLSISQGRLIAKHKGADLISRAQLRLGDPEASNELSLAISMMPVNPESPAGATDPGVYQVDHKLSRDIISEALKQTWVEERRSEAVLRAALVPGLGHIYRGEKRLGWTYLSSALALTVGAVVSGSLGYIAAQDYDKSIPATAHRRDDANAHYDRSNLLWMGVATLYATSLIDTLISAEDRSYLDLDRLKWDQARQSVESRGAP